MGQINVEGIGTVEIEGDTPTPEESAAIVQAVSAQGVAAPAQEFAGQETGFVGQPQEAVQTQPAQQAQAKPTMLERVMQKLRASPFGAGTITQAVGAIGTDPRLFDPITGAGRRDETLAEMPGVVPTDLSKLQRAGEGVIEQKFPQEMGLGLGIEGDTTNLGLRLSAARGNPRAEADIVQKALGLTDDQIGFDSFGNAVVTLPSGERRFINAPGLSKADIVQLIPNLAQDILAARVGGRMGGRGGIGRAIGVGTGLGASSITSDAIAQVVGSEQPPDLKRAGLFALLGTGGEYAVSIGGKFMTSILANRRFVKGDKLTPEGIKAVENAGINPENVTPEFINAFKKLGKAEDAAAAARQAEAVSLPSPVKLTKAQTTRTGEDTAFEASALKGHEGRAAEVTVRAAHEKVNVELARNVPVFQKVLDKKAGMGVIQEGQGAEFTVRRLTKLRDARKAAVTKAYNAAREKVAVLPQESMQVYKTGIDDFLESGGHNIAPETVVVKAKKVMDSLASKKGTTTLELEKFRSFLSGKAWDNRGTTTGKILSEMKHRLDDTLQASLDNALMIGDQSAIAAWRNARKLHMNYAKDFKENKIIAKLMEEDVAPDEALNYLFGVSQLGSGNARNARLALVKIKKIFGKDSKEWSAMRQEALIRMARGKVTLKEGQTIDAGDLAKAIDTAILRKSSLMRELFSGKEIKTLMQLSRVARSTKLDWSKTNVSGTAGELIRKLPFFGPALQALKKMENVGGDVVGFSRAARTTKFSLKGKAVVPTAIGGVAATRQAESTPPSDQ